MKTKIVDTHQHLWDLGVIQLPWLNDLPQLNRSHLLDDYVAYTMPSPSSDFDYEIDQTIYMEVDVAPPDRKKETQWVLDLCRDDSNSLVGMIAAAMPGSEGFQKHLEFAADHSEIKGFRRVLHTDVTPPGTCVEQRFIDDVECMGQQALTFDVCIRRGEIDDAKRLARACPNTQFVLDHCGNADVRWTEAERDEWTLQIQSIAECDNVVCKVSGFVWTIQSQTWSPKKEINPILQVVFDAFGVDRVLFGGDWPVCTLSSLSFSEWVESLFQFSASYGESVVAKLFSENAKRIYRI